MALLDGAHRRHAPLFCRSIVGRGPVDQSGSVFGGKGLGGIMFEAREKLGVSRTGDEILNRMAESCFGFGEKGSQKLLFLGRLNQMKRRSAKASAAEAGAEVAGGLLGGLAELIQNRDRVFKVNA